MELGSPDPRRTREITTRIRGVADKRRAYLFIDGQRWAVVEWGGPGRWCIEDNEHLCLDHIENAAGLRDTLRRAIALAETMIRDGRMPSPEEAKRLAEERLEKQHQQHDAWEHPERLYEPLADTLELWTDRDPDFTRSNSYRRLCDELVAIADGAIGLFRPDPAESALRALHHIEAKVRSHWYGEDAEGARAQVAYAEEHLDRARQIIRTHDPDRAVMPAADTISTEQVIKAAREELTARQDRQQKAAADDPDGTKRAKRRALSRWSRNADMVRFYAALMTDDELSWFSEIDKAARNKTIRRNPDDALRLRDLYEKLSRRSAQRSAAERRDVAVRLEQAELVRRQEGIG